MQDCKHDQVQESAVVTGTRDTSPLASIQYLTYSRPIPKRDFIVLAQVLGFTVVVKKSEFFPNEDAQRQAQLCVFFEPDAVVDKTNANLAFLAKTDWRVTTAKICEKTYSQGLAMPLSLLKDYGIDPAQVREGQDVTQQLNVVKFVSTDESAQYQLPPSSTDEPLARCSFPSFVPRTDEINGQSMPSLVNQLVQNEIKVVITEKVDGCSATFWPRGMASRNYTLLSETDPSMAHYFEIQTQYAVSEKLATLFPNYAVQGEIYGPKINRNHLGMSKVDFAIFNVYDMVHQFYVDWKEVERVASQLNIPTVRTLFRDKSLRECGFDSIEALIAYADKHTYANGKPAEGIVVKTDRDVPSMGRVSFKVIAPGYACK